MRRKYGSYSRDAVKKAVEVSKSWREVIEFLNPDAKGYRGSQSSMKKTAKKFGINFSHFPGGQWNKGKALGPKRPIEDYFNGAPISSNTLKKKLFSAGKKEKKCELCISAEWRNEEIPLELHHKNANPKDNRLDNLEVLCPNCHAYRHLQLKKEGILKRAKVKQLYQARPRAAICLVCGAPSVNKYCSYACSHKANRKIEKPAKEFLQKAVWEKSSLQISKELGLKSSTMIGRWCKEYGIEKPPRGYWEKIYHGGVTGMNTSIP